MLQFAELQTFASDQISKKISQKKTGWDPKHYNDLGIYKTH